MSSQYVPNQILTAEDLNSSFDGKTDNADARISAGFADGLDHVTITGPGASVSPTSGALIVTGGVGIGLSLFVAGTGQIGKELKVLSSLQSTGPTVGAFVVVGGAGFGGNVQIGGALVTVGNITGARIIGTDVTQAVSAVTGALVVAGGVGIGKDTWIAGALHVSGTLSASGGTTLAGPLSVASIAIQPGGDITFGDGTKQATKPIDDAPSDANKYGRKANAWTVLTDLPEAPTDGKKYGRRNATWFELVDTPDAPNDTFFYGRQNGAWAKGTAEAPVGDAFIYGRANGLWVKSVTEAPNDGNQYSRRNGAWQVLSASGMVVGDTPPTDTVRYPQWWDTRSASLFIWYDDGTSAQWVICVPVPETSGGGGGSVVWGAIGGQMIDQADLTAALNAKIGDAPVDTNTYGRKGAAWVALAASGGGLPTDGSGAMTGPLKLADGAAATPSLTFASTPTTGLFFGSSGVNVTVAGVLTAMFGSSQLTSTVPFSASSNGTALNPAFKFQGGNGGLYAKSGSVVAMAAAGLDAMTWDYNAGVPKTTVAGLLSLGATGQIAFPAVVNYSSDPNTLDDYEEGTWTPTITAGALVVNFATYTKIGRMVHVNAFLQFPAQSDPGNLVINGLPFRSPNQTALSIGYQNTAIALMMTAMATGNNVNVYGGAGFATFAQFSGSQFYFAGSYPTAPPESAVISFMNNTGATTFTGPGGLNPDTFWSGRAGTNVTISNVQGNPAAATAMNGQTVPVTVTNAGTRFNLGITTTGISMTGVTATLTSAP